MQRNVLRHVCLWKCEDGTLPRTSLEASICSVVWRRRGSYCCTLHSHIGSGRQNALLSSPENWTQSFFRASLGTDCWDKECKSVACNASLRWAECVPRAPQKH